MWVASLTQPRDSSGIAARSLKRPWAARKGRGSVGSRLSTAAACSRAPPVVPVAVVAVLATGSTRCHLLESALGTLGHGVRAAQKHAVGHVGQDPEKRQRAAAAAPLLCKGKGRERGGWRSAQRHSGWRGAAPGRAPAREKHNTHWLVLRGCTLPVGTGIPQSRGDAGHACLE